MRKLSTREQMAYRTIATLELERDALQQRLTVAEQLMQEFCDRVDRGEVRSKTTYAKFKAALKPAAEGEGS